MDKSFLQELLKIESPSGFEFGFQKYIMEYMKPYTDNFITNHSGNVISVLNNNSKIKILLSAHADEIGLIISDILPNGKAKVTSAGGIMANMYIGHKVCAITLDGRKVPGICEVFNGCFDKKIHADELTIDFGCESKEEALTLVRPGDYVIFDEVYRDLFGSRFTSKALDDKIGCFVILEALKKAREIKAENCVYALTSVGEETTMRGASFAGYMVEPSLAIVVDVTFDTNTRENNGCGNVKLGGGPVLCHSSIVNKKLNKKLEEIASKHSINLQYEVAVGRTGTDADRIYYTKEGIPTALVSIPLRYMHSPSEMCDLKDVQDCIDLLAYFIKEIEEINFNPYEE
ncbi:MAG: M20/M25/M40 family metallo-hydrolase [Anaeroplasma sp.]